MSDLLSAIEKLLDIVTQSNGRPLSAEEFLPLQEVEAEVSGHCMHIGLEIPTLQLEDYDLLGRCQVPYVVGFGGGPIIVHAFDPWVQMMRGLYWTAKLKTESDRERKVPPDPKGTNETANGTATPPAEDGDTESDDDWTVPLTVQGAADQVGCSDDTIRRKLDSLQTEEVEEVRGLRRYRKSELEELRRAWEGRKKRGK